MGANVILQLKKREIQDVIQIPLQTVRRVIDSKDKEQLWTMFAAVAEGKQTQHDKFWLQTICNWAPKDGISVKDISKWLGLVRRVETLNEEKEGPFTLSLSQSDLIWKRLIDPAYKVMSISPNFAAFVMDYMVASKHHFEDVTDEWEDPDEVRTI